MEIVERKRVPDNRSQFLKFSLADVFCRERYLGRVVNKLHKSGIVILGQLVQLSEDDLSHLLSTTDNNKERIKRRLEAYGLELNMDVAEGSLTSPPRPQAPHPH